jgi:hypothetical protein
MARFLSRTRFVVEAGDDGDVRLTDRFSGFYTTLAKFCVLTDEERILNTYFPEEAEFEREGDATAFPDVVYGRFYEMPAPDGNGIEYVREHLADDAAWCCGKPFCEQHRPPPVVEGWLARMVAIHEDNRHSLEGGKLFKTETEAWNFLYEGRSAGMLQAAATR